jgi:transketolase
VEDHYEHGGMGDFVNAALSTENVKLVKIAVTKISTSGAKEQLMDDAGITSFHIIKKVKELIKS